MASPNPPPPPGAGGPRMPPPPRGGKNNMLLWIGLGAVAAGGYYLYTSGGDANAAKRKFETDARNARERSLDGAERVGDKIDRAYDEAKEKIEKGYKSSKAEVEKEWNKEKQEIGKQVEGWVDKIDGKVESVAKQTKETVSNWRK